LIPNRSAASSAAGTSRVGGDDAARCRCGIGRASAGCVRAGDPEARTRSNIARSFLVQLSNATSQFGAALVQ
jgi:hypothetical protein